MSQSRRDWGGGITKRNVVTWTLEWILEPKEDMNGKTGEIEMKSGISSTGVCLCEFLSFDKGTLVI